MAGIERDDPFNLQRFVDAQAPLFDKVRRELTEGRKKSHWMWFFFPQIEGLGYSPTAQKFAISSRMEAEAYLAHEILGPRLRHCAHLVCLVEGRSIDQIFGYPDDLKFHSSMTLFASVASDNQIFQDALRKYFAGRRIARRCNGSKTRGAAVSCRSCNRFEEFCRPNPGAVSHFARSSPFALFFAASG